MTIERKDRIKDTTSSTGTGTITVDGASITGYRPLSTHTSGATVRYLIISPTQSEWEVGEGVWTAAGSTLSRVTVFASSNAGSKVNFAAGVKYVSTLPTAQDLDDARSDLVASFSLTSAAGKSPLADASGKIDPAWVDPIAGVTAAALHRSPNAIEALFVYDTSKDSDGGAWTERCQHTSWYNESLSGRWLGQAASEAAARAVTGATTGDYFQLTTDGKFYRLWKNLLFRSQEVNTGSWSKVGTTVTPDAATAPDGSNTADQMIETTSSSEHHVSQPNVAVVAGTTYTVSVYVKKGVLPSARNFVQLTLPTAQFGGSSYATFDIVNGTVSTQGAGVLSASVTSAGSGWWRCSITDTATVSQSSTIYIGGAQSGTGGVLPTYAGSTDADILLWGAQAEISTAATTYEAKGAEGSISEVFRGNKRDFPKLSAVVAEAASITIYDLTEPGRPMWMRFEGKTDYTTFLRWFSSSGVVPAVAALNGVLFVAGSGGCGAVSFPGDDIRVAGSARYLPKRKVADRNATGSVIASGGDGYAFNNVSGNAVAMTVLPDAPVDPVTGLRVPTIAVATNGSISVIQHSGVVRNSSSTIAFHAVQISPAMLSAARTPDATLYTALAPGLLGGSFALSTRTSTQAPGFGIGNTSANGLIRTTRSELTRRSATAGLVQRLRAWEADLSKSVAATITDSYNTGHMVGDIRRAYLADVSAGSISNPSTVADRSYKAATATAYGTLTKTAVAAGAQLAAYSGFSASNYLQEPYSADLDFGTGEWTCSAWITVATGNAAAGTIAARAYSSGASITLGIDATNKLTATAYDGTTTRTVTTTGAYNTATGVKAEATYRAGRLAILVNGVEVAVTHGTALLTLNNSNAVLTIGNSYALDAPFPGSIALLKFSATVPTAEQSAWMYEQEKQMFREGAQVCLPDSGSVVDLAYDDATDKWIAASATNRSEWSGLVRTSTTAVPAGSYSKTAAGSGVLLTARRTTSPGVDVTLPELGLRRELARRAEAAARLAAQPAVLDYVGGFTATTTNGSSALTSVSGLSVPGMVNLVGCQVTGSGIPASTTITGISGSTIYLSAAATASASGVQISLVDFPLPAGLEAKTVSVAGALKQEGGSATWTRQYDGFRESVRFGTAPGYNAWVQITAIRSVS